MIDETLFEAEEKMERAIEFAKEEFATIRTGRATPAMFARIMIDYYGSPTPLPQMASIAIPEPRMVIIKPHDPSQLKAMEKAIRDSDLGRQPQQRGHPAPHAHPADDRGAPPRDDQGGPAQGRGRQGRDPQRAPQGQGGARPHRQGRRGRRGRGPPGGEGARRPDPQFVGHVDELLKHKEAELLEV